MENNDSPYIYEKPIRSGLKQRSKRLAGLSTLGLVGMFGIFGGSAIANSLVAANPATASNEADAVEMVDPLIDNTDSSVDPLVSAATAEPTSDPAPLVSIPLQEAKPKPNSVKVELPALPNQSYGNTSSATPSVGSGNYSAGSAPAKFEARGERNERHESSHENDREAEHEEESEYEDD
jgi:hypothetical protein